jgi:hypothetical protein
MLSAEALLEAIQKEIADREARRSLLLSEVGAIDREIAERQAALRVIGNVLVGAKAEAPGSQAGAAADTQAAPLIDAPPPTVAPPLGPMNAKVIKRPSQRTAAHQRLEAVHPRGETARDLLTYLQANGYPELTINTLSSLLSYSKKVGDVRHEGLLFFRAPPPSRQGVQESERTLPFPRDEEGTSAAGTAEEDQPHARETMMDAAA